MSLQILLNVNKLYQSREDSANYYGSYCKIINNYLKLSGDIKREQVNSVWSSLVIPRRNFILWFSATWHIVYVGENRTNLEVESAC